MSPTIGIVLRIGSYVVDFIIGFFTNVAWDKCKRKRMKKMNSFSAVQNSDKTVTVDMHVNSAYGDAVKSASVLFTSLSGDNKRVDH
jgi:hypothetical protein